VIYFVPSTSQHAQFAVLYLVKFVVFFHFEFFVTSRKPSIKAFDLLKNNLIWKYNCNFFTRNEKSKKIMQSSYLILICWSWL